MSDMNIRELSFSFSIDGISRQIEAEKAKSKVDYSAIADLLLVKQAFNNLESYSIFRDQVTKMIEQMAENVQKKRECLEDTTIRNVKIAAGAIGIAAGLGSGVSSMMNAWVPTAADAILKAEEETIKKFAQGFAMGGQVFNGLTNGMEKFTKTEAQQATNATLDHDKQVLNNLMDEARRAGEAADQQRLAAEDARKKKLEAQNEAFRAAAR